MTGGLRTQADSRTLAQMTMEPPTRDVGTVAIDALRTNMGPPSPVVREAFSVIALDNSVIAHGRVPMRVVAGLTASDRLANFLNAPTNVEAITIAFRAPRAHLKVRLRVRLKDLMETLDPAILATLRIAMRTPTTDAGTSTLDATVEHFDCHLNVFGVYHEHSLEIMCLKEQ